MTLLFCLPDFMKIKYLVCLCCLWLLSLGLQAQTNEKMKTFRPKLDASPVTEEATNTTTNNKGKGQRQFRLQDNARLDSLLDTLHAYNARIKGVTGYRLLVYTGVDREQAMRSKEQLYRNYPDLEVYVSFVQPTFRVKVGDYLNRYDALRGADRIKGLFPSAVVVGETVRVR
jgi:hypothetical protein